jgi:hypothetical protein
MRPFMNIVEASEKVAAWQGNVLWDDHHAIAEIKHGGGWYVWFPGGSPLMNKDNEWELIKGGENLDSFMAAKQYATRVAKEQGYKIVSNKVGIERFKAANPQLVQNTMKLKMSPKSNATNNEEFMREYWNETFPHPFERGSRLLSNATMRVRPFDGKILISDIMSVEPGKGGGREALKFLCDLADKHGVTLMLTAKEYGTRNTLTTTKLRDWYSRYGFVTKRGNRDYGYDMVRTPNE